jgi:hypothetical protein
MSPIKPYSSETTNPAGELKLQKKKKKNADGSYRRSDYLRDVNKVSRPTGKQGGAKK